LFFVLLVVVSSTNLQSAIASESKNQPLAKSAGR
jgi:hypothetical protein